MNQDWSKKEVELIVEDYFKMLTLELEYQKYNKTSHRQKLLPILKNRSNGSIEFKHQNISAVLANMGQPYIKGYKPRGNYQELLETQVALFLKNHREGLEKKFVHFVNAPTSPLQFDQIDFENIVDETEVLSNLHEPEPTYRPIKINYLEREQNNRNLGEKGEKLVLDYEHWRLKKAGKDNLADKIEWISKDRGDGAGYDILSKNIDGSDRFVEVKTTKLAKETPIYLTKTEVSFAAHKAKNFYLYRVFNFGSDTHFFIKNGHYEHYCSLLPQTFKGSFK